MFKRGICTIEELIYAEKRLRHKHFRKNCYIGLYEEVADIRGSTGDLFQEAVLEAFATTNAVFKRTAKERFGAFDTTTMELLRAMPTLRERCTVHDIAVSDGRTACDWFDKLALEFGEVLDFYATDLCLSVTSLRQPGGHTTIVVDPQKNILQIVLPPFVLSATHREHLLYPMNRLLRAVLMRTAVKRLMRLYREGGTGLEQREIKLLCREAKEHLEGNRNFHIETHDVLQRPPRSYAVVRAMNIFNRSYFSDDVIAKAVGNIMGSIQEGGVFVTGSNDNAGSTVNGTIYQRDRRGVVPIYISGAGSQIDQIITRARAN